MGRLHIALVGGSGFVGHNLSVALADKGYKVLVIDNNDCNIGESSSVTFRRANITDEVAMRSALAEFAPAVWE
jgi:nucleoside-diphosphate-sugar epimerase